MPLLLSILLACSGDDDGSDTQVPACPPPQAAIVSPTDRARFVLGEDVTVVGEASGTGVLFQLWGVDSVQFGIGAEAVWTAEPLGERLLTFQVQDDCDIVTTSVYVTVYEE